jgi:hypothetical protein
MQRGALFVSLFYLLKKGKNEAQVGAVERKETEKSCIDVKGTRILHRALHLSLNRGDALTHIKSTLANAVALWVITTALPFDN